MFVSIRYVWGFVDLENWITITDFHDPLVGIHGSSLACVWPEATSSRGFEPIFGCAAVADALALSLEPIVEKMLTVVSIFSFK